MTVYAISCHMDRKPIRMWEILTCDGSEFIRGVVLGLPPGTKPGECAMMVDKTIRTSLIVDRDGQLCLTQSGTLYELTGPSRDECIEAAKRTL